MYNEDVARLTNYSLYKIASETDQFILNFFGSEELVRKYAHLYILETKEVEFTPKLEDALTITYTMQVETRIRLKTPEELASDERTAESKAIIENLHNDAQEYVRVPTAEGP